jgi:hypothetical protein
MSRSITSVLMLAGITAFAAAGCTDADVTGPESDATARLDVSGAMARADALAWRVDGCLDALNELAAIPADRIAATGELRQLAVETIGACSY